MSNFRIRKANDLDAPALSHICLMTADAGLPAASLHDLKELPGAVYAVPYVQLPHTWAFVLEKTSTGEVVGYIIGSDDTRAYEQYATKHWWPILANQYPPELAVKPDDLRYTQLLRNMHTAPDSNIAFSPAHMHIDILPDYQRQGWGRKLIATAVDYLRQQGLQGIWLGLDPRNTNARSFYERLGFQLVAGAPDENQMGLKFVDFIGTSG